jgi:hypothetical protein
MPAQCANTGEHLTNLRKDRIMARFIIVALLFLASVAQAQTVGIHTISAHTNGGMNNVNPGLYIRHGGVTFGTYRNSHRKQSAYLGYTWETEQWHSMTVAVTAGAITGYPRASVMPMLVPSVAYHFGQHAVRVGIVPKPPIHGSSAAVHLMFETHKTL